MKGKCLKCENYYLMMKFRKDKDEKTMEMHGCNSPDVVAMPVTGEHPFSLDSGGHSIEILECNYFEPKEK